MTTAGPPDAYDLVPYASYPFPHSHPERLFTIARLFGRDPAPCGRARVLELGCAGGGNLIPMASAAPDASFLGIDLSARHIEAAQARIDRLGLPNIEVRAQSILDVDQSLGTFDYILCHGVYSWVPAEVRAAILAICGRQLRPQGVAYISYNTLPGWNMVRTLRDLMLFHVRHISDAAGRVEQARSILPFVIEALGPDTSPYAAWLRAELSDLDAKEDSYVFHEHLEAVNEPVYFRDFVGAARAEGLDYLAEADLASMFAGNFSSLVAARLLQTRDIIDTEQYMDFIRNRRFRSSILCRADGYTRRAVPTSAVRQFYLTSVLRPAGPVEAHTLRELSPLDFHTTQPVMTAHTPVAKAALCVLAQGGQRPIAYEVLVERVAALSGIGDRDRIRAELEDGINLMRLVFAGYLDLYSSPPAYRAAAGPMPRASALARDQAAHGEPVTNQRHQLVQLDEVEARLLPLLDGATALPELAVRMETEEPAVAAALGRFADAALLV